MGQGANKKGFKSVCEVVAVFFRKWRRTGRQDGKIKNKQTVEIFWSYGGKKSLYFYVWNDYGGKR